MSLVIAIKDKDRIVFGADKQVSGAGSKLHNTIKIWDVPELPGAIMGGVGSLRASQVIQYSKLIDLNAMADLSYGTIDTNYIITVLVPQIVLQLQSAGVCCIAEDDVEEKTLMLPNSFLFAYEDQAWMIWNDLSVSEIEDYLAIGSASDVAKGVLFATSDKNPFDRIVTCIDAAAETTLYVDHGIDFLATKFYDKDRSAMCKALGLEQPKKVTSKKKVATKTKKEAKKA